MNDKVRKMIELYQDSYDRFVGVFVYKNLEPLDSDFTSIFYDNDVFYFEFGNNIRSFEVKVNDIDDIIFDKIGQVTITTVILKNGMTILINNL